MIRWSFEKKKNSSSQVRAGAIPTGFLAAIKIYFACSNDGNTIPFFLFCLLADKNNLLILFVVEIISRCCLMLPGVNFVTVFFHSQ